MTEQVNTSDGTRTGSGVAGGGAGDANAPSPVVTQVDRDAAAWVVQWQIYAVDEWSEHDENARQYFHRDFPTGIKDGVFDYHDIVKAFARHRIAEQERCARVADEHVITADDDVQAAYARAAIDIAEVIRRGQ